MIGPGAIIGIVGGGQLGRMLAIAAAQLGYKCHVFDPHEHPPAAEVAAFFTRAAFDDGTALERFAESVETLLHHRLECLHRLIARRDARSAGEEQHVGTAGVERARHTRANRVGLVAHHFVRHDRVARGFEPLAKNSSARVVGRRARVAHGDHHRAERRGRVRFVRMMRVRVLVIVIVSVVPR